jgi:hypothetical protein
MSFLHKQSYECTKSELDLFEVPPTQISFENARIVDYFPIANIDNGPIEFFISGSSDEYIDLSQTFLYIEGKISLNEKDATANAAVNDVPVNYFLHSIFSQVDVSLNETNISSSVNSYPYRCIFETLLNYGGDAKRSHLAAAMFYKDTATKMNAVDNSNLGGLVRTNLTKTEGAFSMYGRLHVDMFFQDRLLINNVNVRLKLNRSKDAFCIISNCKSSKLKITQAMLTVRKVKVNPKIMLAHAAVLEKSTIKYPVKRVELKSFTINAGLRAKTLDNVSLGPLPKRVVFALVNSSGFNGDFTLNPFNFEHYKLTKVSVSIDGEDAPYSPVTMDFDSNLYAKAYYTLFNGLDRAGLDSGNEITPSDFQGGYCMFAFDLTPDMCSGDHFNLVKSGNLRIGVTFAEDLPNNVNCVVYMEHENIIEINKSRNIICDFKI